MRIIVPMAGRGKRFADHGFETPKPFIEIAGKPMFLWALDSLLAFEFSALILVVLEEHEKEFSVSKLVKNYLESAQGQLGTVRGKIQVLTIPEVTEGQLCTVLAAKTWLNREEDVLIAASDTYIRGNLARDIQNRPGDCAGIISVIDLPGEQWSFAQTDENGRVVQVAEKQRISNHASTGLYYFSKGGDLVSIGEKMIRDGERTRGEYYVIPVYQKMIEAGQQILISPATEMWDMGTPEAKAAFESHLQNQ